MTLGFTTVPLKALFDLDELDIHVFVLENCLFSFAVSLQKRLAAFLAK